MNEFEEIFDKIARTDDVSILWTNWLDWVIDQNLIIDNDRGLDFKGNEYVYFDLFKSWVNIVNNELENTDKYYYDYLGVFYEDIIQSKYKKENKGQFFTPQSVSDLMANLVLQEEEKTILINDCACGSGRLLLDTHKYNPNSILIGQDLDSVACKMCVLNFYISGVRGSVINQNTLTGEFYEAWRVNNYINQGLPIPHIELVNEKEAYNFIGVDKNNIIEVHDEPKSVKKSIQTTLC